MNRAGLITSQRQKLNTSDATIGPAVKRTKPMIQGERKISASRVSRLGRRDPGRCIGGAARTVAAAAAATSAGAFASIVVFAVVIFWFPLPVLRERVRERVPWH
jgi:hypothetical protein